MKGGGPPVRLLMDARGIGRSGIGRYAHVVLDELMGDNRFSEIHLLGEPSLLEPYRDMRDGVRISQISSSFYSPRYQLEWQLRRMRGELGADVYFFPHYDAPLRLPPRSVVAVHDLIHFTLPHLFPVWKQAAASVLLRRVVAQAAHIVVLSHTTRTDLSDRIPSSAVKTSIVPLGFDPAFLSAHKLSAESATYAESIGPFLLCVGNRKPHKNLIAAVEALALVRRKIPAMRLVVVGGRYPGWEDVVSRTEELGVSDAILDLDNASDETLRALYAHCTCLLFPSLYEGLGLPVLEAFAHGVPVIASNRSSVPELVADAGLLIDPTSPEQIAAAILRLDGDQGMREELIRRGRGRCEAFDWAGAATALADLFYAVSQAEESSLSGGWRDRVDLWPRGPSS